MGVMGMNLRHDVFVGSVVLPASALTACLCYWQTPHFIAVLPVFVFIGAVIAESMQEFLLDKSSRSARQHVQSHADVMRISRALYSQLDTDLLQLLASSRDFDENDIERLQQLDSFRFGGATELHISRLPLVPVTDQMLQTSECTECSICLADVALGSHVRLLRCFHHFHPECIDPWLQSKAECPMCKFPAIG